MSTIIVFAIGVAVGAVPAAVFGVLWGQKHSKTVAAIEAGANALQQTAKKL